MNTHSWHKDNVYHGTKLIIDHDKRNIDIHTREREQREFPYVPQKSDKKIPTLQLFIEIPKVPPQLRLSPDTDTAHMGWQSHRHPSEYRPGGSPPRYPEDLACHGTSRRGHVPPTAHAI